MTLLLVGRIALVAWLFAWIGAGLLVPRSKLRRRK